jgi:mRNA interferase RelE/StbE
MIDSEIPEKKYKIEFTKECRKSLKNLPTKIKNKIIGIIHQLEKNPYTCNSKKLKAKENVYRIRQGDYRIIYEIINEELIIVIIDIKKRDDRTYKNI